MAKKSNLPKISDTPISPKALYERLSKVVVGQDAAKRLVCQGVFLHFVRWLQFMETGEDLHKSNVLLMGPTGSGKTYMVKEVSKILQSMVGVPICPVLEVDCTELSARGWEGDNISDMLWVHSKRINNEHVFASSIVFLDEFDKLCKPAISNSGNDHNKNTQYNLLKVVEGCELKDDKSPETIDTNRMLFVMAGNFSEIRHLRKLKANTMGFKKLDPKKVSIDYHQELEKIGMSTQLIGRTAYVGQLEALQAADLHIILEEHLIPSYTKTWDYIDLPLKLTKVQRNRIVKQCLKHKTGARGLETGLLSVIDKNLFEAELKNI